MLLDQSETPLILVRPTDQVETILARALEPRAARVQLLVPDGVAALQRPEALVQLAQLTHAAGITLLLISSDPTTLKAAEAAQIATLAVAEAHVQAPPAPRPSASGKPASADDAFLAQLDQLPARASAADPADLSVVPTKLAVARPTPPSRPARTMTNDELLDATLSEVPKATPSVTRPIVVPPLAHPDTLAVPPERTWRGRPEPVGTRVTSATSPDRRQWPLVGLGLLLVLLVAFALLWNSRVTVTVAPPVRPDTVEPITALPVPITKPGSATTTAVEAESFRSDVAFSNAGEVTETTMAPSGSAGGILTIFNSTQQAVTLPAGTEFTAIKPDGQEVPFVSTADAQIPAATTRDYGAEIVTSLGQATIPLTARSAGSASNIEANLIRRVTPPGGPSFNLGTGSFRVQHGPLSGGSEAPVRIVKDSDVRSLLAPALEGLDAEARRQLDGLARAKGLTLDPDTIVPRRAELEQLNGFEYTVQPPVGQNLDPASPRFSLTVQAAYSGLGVPADKPLRSQLGPILTEQLLQAGRLVAGNCRAPAVTNWHWDGQSLLVDGQIAPDTLSPGCNGGLDPATLNQIHAALRGKSREQAQTALDALVAQGLISGYSLPDVQRLPDWDWQLVVKG